MNTIVLDSANSDEDLAREVQRIRRLRVACATIATNTEANRPKGPRERPVRVDGLIKNFLDQTLAAYALSDGDPETFVVKMEERAKRSA